MKSILAMSLAIALVACQSSSEKPQEIATAANAALGVTTAIPSEGLAGEMGLEFQVRQQGRLVKSVDGGSAAYEAGIRSGDVLLQLGDVTLYSQDDIDDFLSVHEPGSQVHATLVRSGTKAREELQIELDAGAARKPDTIRWQYASLAQLPAAREQARAEKKKVLVGLSGAET